jgi:hypothetical protein
MLGRVGGGSSKKRARQPTAEGSRKLLRGSREDPYGQEEVAEEEEEEEETMTRSRTGVGRSSGGAGSAK